MQLNRQDAKNAEFHTKNFTAALKEASHRRRGYAEIAECFIELPLVAIHPLK
jgi:hypothetical protein